MNLAILTGGLLLLCMALPSREKTFVPGELSGKHAQILDNTLVAQRCSLCHQQSHGDGALGQAVMAVLGGEISGGHASDGKQDALCMQCHQGHMPAAAQRTPHDLSSESLRALAENGSSSAWHLVSNDVSKDEHAETSKTHCAACHVEHHGRDFDLKAMADDRCQACHRRKFESFTNGHPEFKNFPAERPRSLAFSHQLHADKHFPQKSRDFDCRKCHVDQERPTSFGPVTRSISFEAACAECHQEPIRAATIEGWALLQLPSIDASAATPGSPLEHWPVDARFGFEGTISPALRALLEGDEAAREALASLPESGQLSDIPLLGDQREHVTRSLALATQRLIRDTAQTGQAAWHERLLKVTRTRAGREPDALEIALIDAMCAGLPPDLFRQMQTAWFDDARALAVSQPTSADRASVTTTNDAGPVHPERKARALTPALRHQRAILVERKTSGLLVSDERGAADDLLLSDSDSQPSINSTSNSNSDDALLAPGPAGSQLLDTELLTPEPSDSDLLSSEAIDSGTLGLPQLNADTATADGTDAPLTGATHLTGGGWYIDRQTLALRYMPTGHADKTLAAWSMWWAMFDDAASAAKRAGARPAGEHVAAKTIPQQIPGGCLHCHQLSSLAEPIRASAPSLEAAWQVPVRSPARKEFTQFDHTPHLSLPAVNDCRYCHVLRDRSTSGGPSHYAAAGYGKLVNAIGDAHTHHLGSEFREMQLSQCVACHRPSGANSGCLQCHNYHISPPSTDKIAAPH